MLKKKSPPKICLFLLNIMSPSTLKFTKQTAMSKSTSYLTSSDPNYNMLLKLEVIREIKWYNLSITQARKQYDIQFTSTAIL
jgi:hypothetical protein